MGKILGIFKSDVQKIFKSKMATIILCGLIFIPGIYAWLNIDSNWEPYENTGNLKVAVVNHDQGTTLLNKDINMGDSLVDNLESNNAMNWIITDEDNAKTGVESGNYYGAIIFPENFSDKITTLFNGDHIEKPKFDFYVNEKKNPIAPIIVNKAISTIQTTLDQAFVNSIVYDLVDEAKSNNITSHIESATTTTITKLNQAKDNIKQLRSTLDIVSTATDSTSNALSAVRDLAPAITTLSEHTTNTIENTRNTLNSLNNTYDKHSEKVHAAINTAEDLIKTIEEMIKSIETTINENTEDPNITTDILKDLLTELKNQLAKIIAVYNEASNNIDHAFAESIATTDTAAKTLDIIDVAITKTDTALAHTISALDSTSTLAQSSSNLLLNLEYDIDEIIQTISDLTKNEIYIKIVNLLKNSPEDVADFISEPIATNEINIYPIANYGSKMSPFYTILAAWVGCTVLIAVLKTDIENDKKFKKIKPHQAFFGRFLLFGTIAMSQGLVIGLGDLIMQVQVINHPLFLFTIMLSSLVFMLIAYSLSISFGKIGSAIVVVIMVLQVAGSGGTFPIELLPSFFQTLQPAMPFYPAMNALRETIGGFYQNTYFINILLLLCHTIIPLLLGLVIRKPIIKLKHIIARQVEETDIIV